MVICLERGADLHMAQQIPLPLTVSRSRKIQIGFTFLVLADLGSPGQRAVKRGVNTMVKCMTDPAQKDYWLYRSLINEWCINTRIKVYSHPSSRDKIT